MTPTQPHGRHPLFNQIWCVGCLIGDDVYTFTFNLDNYREMLVLVGKMAADPGLNMTHEQAMFMCDKIRGIVLAAQQVVAATKPASQMCDHSDRWW